MKFLLQPGEDLGRLFELGVLLKVIEKAEVRVEGYYTCVFADAGTILIMQIGRIVPIIS